MKATTLSEIKRSLNELSHADVTELTLRLCRFKKENKELLTYLLFESQDENAFIRQIKQEMDEQLQEMNRSNLYLVKKSLRKILRSINKFIRFSGKRETEVELRIYFCTIVKTSGITISKSQALINIYEGQLKKINDAIATLHEDLQYDFLQESSRLELNS